MPELESLARAFNVALRHAPNDEARLAAQDIALNGVCQHCGEVTDAICQCWNDE